MSGSFARQNQLSLTTLVVVVIYVCLAFTVHLAFIGIFPALLAFQAIQRKEKLAPLAGVAAAVSIVIFILAITHH
jgi:amino acid transporter